MNKKCLLKGIPFSNKQPNVSKRSFVCTEIQSLIDLHKLNQELILVMASYKINKNQSILLLDDYHPCI